MNKRIKEISNLINDSELVFDVGSDHAYLSIDLINRKKAKEVINFEINEEPLKAGFSNVKRHELEDSISFVLNDGLKNYKPNKIPDFITISGLGTNTIIDIVSNVSFKPKNYILQSNNPNMFLLRKYMAKLNYKIKNEIIVLDNNIHYEIIHFERSLLPVIYSQKDLFLGPILLKNKDKNFLDKTNKRIEHLSKIIKSTNNKELIKEYNYLRKLIV